jgi:ribosomal subunit interface protein
MSISDEHREYIDKKVNRLRRMCPKIDELSFTLTKEKVHVEVEGNFRAGRIAAQAFVTASQPLEAIDALIDKLEAQICKAKARMADKQSENLDKASARQSAGEPVEEEALES